MTWLIASIGWAGAVSMLLAYLLLLGGRVGADGHLYLSLNFAGSACLAVSTSAAHAWPSAAVNLIWLVIGLAPLLRAWAAHSRRERRSAAGVDLFAERAPWRGIEGGSSPLGSAASFDGTGRAHRSGSAN